MADPALYRVADAPAPVSLVPRPQPFEWAQSLTSADRRPLPADLIRGMWNPATCPLALLPYMAAGLGLELWNDAWSEAKKRAVVSDVWRIKRNKTKLKGIADYLTLVGADLVAAHRPRDAAWLVRTITDAERAAQMAAMPQIRIHPARPVTATLPRAFASGRLVRQALRDRALCGSDAAALYAGRAEYVDGTASVPVTLRGIDDVLGPATVVEIGSAASVARLFAGGAGAGAFLGRGALLASDADDDVLSIVPDASAPSFAVPAGLVPSSVRPVTVAACAPARAGQSFVGRSPVGAGAPLASDALDHVYQQITLFDPSRMVASRTPYSFVGVTRLRRRPYTAEVLVDVPLTRPPRAAGFGLPIIGTFVRRSDMGPFWDAVAAVRAAKAVRDFVWISTTLYEPIQFSAGLRFGDPGFARFGDSRKVQ